MTETSHRIKSSEELPKDGPTQVVKYNVWITVDGKKYRRGFNLDPGQDVEEHIEIAKKEIVKQLEEQEDEW